LEIVAFLFRAFEPRLSVGSWLLTVVVITSFVVVQQFAVLVAFAFGLTEAPLFYTQTAAVCGIL
jgi:uncharacterized membrane protein